MTTVEAMAEKDGSKCLKFENKQGIPIHPNDWIAGVDCNHPQHHDNWTKNNNEDQDDKAQSPDDDKEMTIKEPPTKEEDDETPNLITDEEESDNEDDNSIADNDTEQETYQEPASKEETAEIAGVVAPTSTESIDESPVTAVSNDEDEPEETQPQTILHRSGRVRQMAERFEPGTTNVQWQDKQINNMTSNQPKEIAS